MDLFFYCVCVCYSVLSVSCSLVYLLEKGWLLGFPVCDVFLRIWHFPMRYPGSDVVLCLIDSWSLPWRYFLSRALITNVYNRAKPFVHFCFGRNQYLEHFCEIILYLDKRIEKMCCLKGISYLELWRPWVQSKGTTIAVLVESTCVWFYFTLDQWFWRRCGFKIFLIQSSGSLSQWFCRSYSLNIFLI